MAATSGLFPAAYFGPIYYYGAFVQTDSPIIDVHEHFIKQTLRSRMRILAANGQLTLSIPIQHTGKKQPMNQVEIDHAENWQTNHLRSLSSAYNASPYFQYYYDDLAEYYNTKFTFLTEALLASHQITAKLMGMELTYKKSQAFYPYDNEDFRTLFSNKSFSGYSEPTYTQVFSYKFGFTQALSVLDLLFNLGPQTRLYIPKIRFESSKSQ